MGTAMVLACIAWPLLFVSGVRLGPVFKILAVPRRAGARRGGGLALPAGAAALLPRPVGPRQRLGLPGHAVVDRLGSGHLVGAGLGGGQQQWGFLPNAHTDFIFSVIGEELGFVGAVPVLLLLGAFVWLGIRAATRSPDRFGGLLAIGLVAWVASET
jgi:cell division protein FtsW (lipid II flippase)